MNSLIFYFILITSLTASASLYQSCIGNLYIYVSNKKKIGLFLAHSGFDQYSDKKFYAYLPQIKNENFLKSLNLILDKKNILDGTYRMSDLCDCDADFTNANEDEVLSKQFKSCLSDIDFEKLGETRFSYYYEKVKWIFLGVMSDYL